ncbi:MAG: glycosyltransferase family 2 protein [Acidobacteria bacterium]|nr:glycosyltransferase family 2 protein [Acidobacteriota bacterium]
MKDAVDVSAIIISLNSKRYLGDCIRSLKSAVWRKVTYEIIVVDNGSTDGTLEELAAHPDVRVIANRSNLGYCKAGNQGAEIARGRYFLHLNDDILILEDALPKLVEWMDRNPKAAMIGSRLLNLDRTDQFSSGRSFTTPWAAIFGRKSVLTRLFPNSKWARDYLLSHKIDSAEPYEVDWLSAAAMMTRREPYWEVGGLAEDFYYFHEQVICAKLQEAGWNNYLHPQSKIVHYEGAGSGVRTRKVRMRHIRSFHEAAHKWYCLHHNLGPANPLRWASAALLGLRAGSLMLLEAVRQESDRTKQEMEMGRPEGGVAI